MNDSLRPETNTRHTQKCSACRHRKKKCSPHDRDWENSQQRCEFCETHDLPCGPNVRYNEDPAVIRRRAVVPENANAVGSNQAREGSTVWSTPNIPAPTARRTRVGNEGPPNASRVEYGREPFDTTSVEDLEGKAFSKFHEFHALGNTLAYASQPAFVYCHAHGSQQPYHDLSIEEKLHDLFINIYGIAVKANARNESHVARWVLFALIFGLDQYPRLFDKRKRNILLKIALMFQELGHRWECEHVLLKIAGMYKNSTLPSQEDSFHLPHLLANSFPTSSMSIRRVLVDRWNETVGGNHVDSNLNVPPLHIAVQYRNPSIIMALLSNPNDCGSSPLAPSLTTPSNVGQVRVNIDERDLNSRTALFTAVANGDESCCFALLLNGADANTRDDHGHTALEVAVRGGYLNIVKNLIDFNALVNPDITGCSSLPLHAAIESGNFQLEIIRQLLDSGAEVDLRRYADNKHAIDLAVDRGYHELAESMRRMIPGLHHTPFMLRDSSMGNIVP